MGRTPILAKALCLLAVASSVSVAAEEPGPASVAGKPGPAPQIEELFRFLSERGVAQPPAGVMVCTFGLTVDTFEFSRRVLSEWTPPGHRAHVAFFHLALEDRRAIAGLLEAFPDRAHDVARDFEFESLCSVLLLSVEDPRFTAEDLRRAARSGESLLAHLHARCDGERAYACRFFKSSWDAFVGDSASCGKHFCVAAAAEDRLHDPLLESVDCDALTSTSAPASSASQWQQDWFVYRNFVRGTPLDTRARRGEEDEAEEERSVPRGVFVDVGAFHPIHLSNTFFFERCLGWRGLCAEPNPTWVPHFNAYRRSCELARHCAWSRPKSVVMSFAKDPIEAYIQEEGALGEEDSGAVRIVGNGSHPSFLAECRTLKDLLVSAGLSPPQRVDYMSVDAEAAEVEIFRDFPFADFDISVISVEVQARNYYDLDVIFFMAGYAKLAVLGGDHVYAKLQRQTVWPEGTAAWHHTLSQDFYTHVAPQTAALSGQSR